MKKRTIITLCIAALAVAVTGDSITGTSLTSEEITRDPAAEAIDGALFQQVSLIDRQVDFPRPTVEAAQELQKLAGQYPDNPSVLENLAGLQIKLGKFSDAEAGMRKAAGLYKDKAAGLKKLADFYHARLNINREVETLMALAPLQEGLDRIVTYRMIISLQEEYLLTTVDRIDIFRKIVAAKPDEADLRTELVRELITAGRTDDALREIDQALAAFPKEKPSFLALKADVYRTMKDFDKALAVFDIEYDPIDGLTLFSKYADLLRTLDRYERYRRDMSRRYRLNEMDERGYQRYFLLLRSERRFDEAEKLLHRWAGIRKPLDQDELGMFARAYTVIGKTPTAWKFAYRKYLTATTAADGEDALWMLFHLTSDMSDNDFPLPAAMDIYLNGGIVNDTPGASGGVLSLLYNDQDLDWRVDDLSETSRQFALDQMLLTIFDEFMRKYPDSKHVAGMYAIVVDTFNDYGKYDTAYTYAKQFFERYEKHPAYLDVANKALTSLYALKNNAEIEKLYKSLIRRADTRDEDDSYRVLIGRLVSFFEQTKNRNAAIKLYWDEININPKDHLLYQRFLEYLANHQIYDEELKVYQKAIEQFEDNSYYSKMARWYIRNKRTTEFQNLTRQVADIFADSELATFFEEFLYSGSKSTSPDSVFYRTMYEYANRRFPRNLTFVDGLLNFYSSHKLWDDFDSLSMKYFYATENIRKTWLRQMSKMNRLDADLVKVTGGSELSGMLEGTTLPALSESPAELLFLAETARWKSWFESAEPIFTDLIRLYPGEIQYVSALASLKRSFEKKEEARELYASLQQLNPHERQYPTLAGELSIEAGDVNTAAVHWQQIIDALPSDEDRYLEVATIFWDYYYFDKAAGTILTARKRLNNPALFGDRLAAVYESAKDYESAIAEYVENAAANWDGYWAAEESINRLVYLSQKHGMEARVKAAFGKAMELNPLEQGYLRVYAMYLQNMNLKDERTRLLANAIDRFEKVETIEWLTAQFRGIRRPDLEERAIRRIIVLQGRDTENLLKLADFYERNKEIDKASYIHDQRIEMTKTDEPEGLGDYISALDAAAQFAWRQENRDAAYKHWNTAARTSTGSSQKERLYQLAVRYIEKDYFDQATAVLNELLEGDPTSPRFFNTLARIYTAHEDYAGLAALYRKGIAAVTASQNIGRETKLNLIASMRRGLIDNLVKLGDFTAGLDQYIEIINRSFDSVYSIGEAYRFAFDHKLVDRLIGYYKTTAEKSNKDYRWATVLARLYELNNEPEAAEKQWRLAVGNEPQKIEVREALAAALVKQEKFTEAIAQYDEIYRLDRYASHWLITIGRIKGLAGDIDGALLTLDKLLEKEKPVYYDYFQVAEVLVELGRLEPAVERMRQGLTVLKADIYAAGLDPEHLNMYIEVEARLGNIVKAYEELLTLNSVYTQEANRQGNNQAWQARNGQSVTYNAFGGKLAVMFREYASAEARNTIRDRLNYYTATFPNNHGTLRFVKFTAEPMGLNDVTVAAIDAELKLLNTYNTRSDYRTAIIQALAYFEKRGMAREAADLLKTELARSSMFTYRDDILLLLDDLYTGLGDDEGRIATLKDYWKSTGGKALAFGTNDRIADLLTLLKANGRDRDLKEIAGTINSYSGQAINFFITNDRIDLAITAIDTATAQRSPKWRDSKKLLIRTYLGTAESSVGTAGSPEDLMQDIPVARRLDLWTDTDRHLVGDEWFGFLSHFARYMVDVKKDDRFRGYLAGITEGSPRSTSAYRSVAEWYVEKGLYQDAMKYFDLAMQLPGSQTETWKAMGAMYAKQGRKTDALNTWLKMLDNNASPDTFNAYQLVCAEYGMFEQASLAIGEYIRENLEGYPSYNEYELLSTFGRLSKENGSFDTLVDAFISRSREIDEPVELLSYAFDDLELDVTPKMEILEEILQVCLRSSTEEDGWQYQLSYWLERALDYAWEQKDYNRLLAWIDLIEQKDLSDSMEYRYSNGGRLWELKARALFATGKKEAALEALRKYYEPENGDYPSQERYRTAYEILSRAGEHAAAEDLMIGFYGDIISRGTAGQSHYLGMASTLLDRAKRTGSEKPAEEALYYLGRAVSLNNNETETWYGAAGTLESHDRHEAAIRFRKSLRSFAPSDYDNLLQLAVDYRITGKIDDALEIFRLLIASADVPLSIKQKSVDPYIECFKGAAAKARQEMALYTREAPESEIQVLMFAALADAAGDTAAADKALEDGYTMLPHVGLIARQRAMRATATGDLELATTFQKGALSLDPTPGNRVVLLNLLQFGQKDLAAFQLFDSFGSEGLYLPSENDMQSALSLDQQKLAEMYEQLVVSALRIERFDLAEDSENRRLAILRELGIAAHSRLDEIAEQRKMHEAPEPKLTIKDTIAN